MKISAAFRDAFRVYTEHFGDTLKFLVVEACITLAAFTPLLFLTDPGLKMLTLLAVPFYVLLVFGARVNAAVAMRDALRGGRLFSRRLAEPDGYGRKLLYGVKRLLMILGWAAPMIACVIIARTHMSGDLDGFTLLRMIKDFGGGDLMTGVLYLALIFVATLLLLTFGCAFHSADRHAFVRQNPRLIKGHRGKIVLCWLCSLAAVLPILLAVIAVVIRYLPALGDLTAVVTGTRSLPSTRGTVIILAAGALLTVPLLPLRSLIPAALVNGLEKE